MFCGHGGAFFRAFVPAAKALSGAYEEGIAGMLTIIKASLLAWALMLLESCTGYLTSCGASIRCPRIDRATDRCVGLQATMWPMPIVAM